MSDDRATDSLYTVEAFFDLLKAGVLGEDDRVELLDGVIVAEPPMDPPHATGIGLAAEILGEGVRGRAVVRVQAPLLLPPDSAPEPDVAVVPGVAKDYWERHPTSALLVLEVSSSSLQQDRLSKSRIYAGDGIPEYWVVNLRDECVEIFRSPERAGRLYVDRRIAGRGEQIALLAFPDVRVSVDSLLPPATSAAEPGAGRALDLTTAKDGLAGALYIKVRQKGFYGATEKLSYSGGSVIGFGAAHRVDDWRRCTGDRPTGLRCSVCAPVMLAGGFNTRFGRPGIKPLWILGGTDVESGTGG